MNHAWCGFHGEEELRKEHERELQKIILECKALHHSSRRNPKNERARRKWIVFANEHIMAYRDELVAGIPPSCWMQLLRQMGCLPRPSPASTDNALLRHAGRDKDEVQRTRIVRKMILAEDVDGVRHLLKESPNIQQNLTDVTYPRNNFNILELALIFDLSIEMVRAILEEGVINKSASRNHFYWNWPKDSRFVTTPFRCQYKLFVQYFDLLAALGFDFSKVRGVNFYIPVKGLDSHNKAIRGAKMRRVLQHQQGLPRIQGDVGTGFGVNDTARW